MSKYFVTVLLWLLPVLAAALPANDKPGTENDLMATIYTDCLKKESINCIKYKVFSYVDKMLADKEDFTLTDGITVVKTSNANEEGAPRSVLFSPSFFLSKLLRLLRTDLSFLRIFLFERSIFRFISYRDHRNCRSIESSDLDTLLFDRLGRFLRTYSIKVDLKGTDILGAIESAGRSFEDFTDNAVESRGKKSN